MRILTLNLWNVFGPWERRRDEVVRWLRELVPDVVCLQEVVGGSRRQLDELVAPLKESGLPYHATYRGVPYEESRLGNAILTRRPHACSRALELPPGEPREPTRMLVGVDHDSSRLLCTHLTAHRGNERFRERQIESVNGLIADLLREDPRRPVILAGDLNCAPDAPELRRLLGGEPGSVVDAWRVAGSGEGHTWDHSNPFTERMPPPPSRLDYVFVSAGLAEVSVERARVVCDRPLTGVFASDHFGLLVDLEVPGGG